MLWNESFNKLFNHYVMRIVILNQIEQVILFVFLDILGKYYCIRDSVMCGLILGWTESRLYHASTTASGHVLSRWY